MFQQNKTTRRNVLKTGLASIAITSLNISKSLASWKAPSETRVLFQWGDCYHNTITPEWTFRQVLAPANCRLMFAQSIQFVTPELLSTVDLFVLQRFESSTHEANLTLEWVPERFVEDRPSSIPFMSDEFEDMVVENVQRGMGLISLHCSLWNPSKAKYMKLIGVEKPYMHHPFQSAYLHKLNPNHPITAGIEPSDLGMDEIFYADLVPGQSEVLFNLKGEQYETDMAGGWCRKEGKGRVIVLLPGHLQTQYTDKSYKEILWRSAHWAMKKDIPASDHIRRGFQ